MWLKIWKTASEVHAYVTLFLCIIFISIDFVLKCTGSEDQDVDAVDDFRREVNNTEGEVEFDGDAGDWKRKYFEVLGKI